VLAGFTEAGESLEGTVRREIREEVGLVVDEIGYLGSQPWPFPRSLMIGFAALADPARPIVPADGEIESAAWYRRADLARLLAAGGQAKDLDPSDRGELPADFALPDQVSIARRMIEGWIAAGAAVGDGTVPTGDAVHTDAEDNAGRRTPVRPSTA
jgi:NAD+ diphosphatase